MVKMRGLWVGKGRRVKDGQRGSTRGGGRVLGEEKGRVMGGKGVRVNVGIRGRVKGGKWGKV